MAAPGAAEGPSLPVAPTPSAMNPSGQRQDNVSPEDVRGWIANAIREYEETRLPRPRNNTEAPVASSFSSPHMDGSHSSVQNWHQMKFTAKLIPSFSGREEENVVRWVERVSAVARMYSVTDEALLLAAVSQLKDRALGWYNRQPLETLATWENFKFQLRLYFERKESYTATLARISS